jgi:4'-phosphopantetheinyl transferase
VTAVPCVVESRAVGLHAEPVWPGVWVSAGPIDRYTDIPPHPTDALTASAMPAWRATEFLAGRAILRRLLATVAPTAADAELPADRRGRPVVAGMPGIGVSVSHDDGMVAACVGHGRVGVDIQGVPALPPDGLLDRCLGRHAGTVAHLSPARQAEELAWVWSVQEACVKAAGTGMGGLPWTIDVPPGASAGRWGDHRWRTLRDRFAVPLSCAVQIGSTE